MDAIRLQGIINELDKIDVRSVEGYKRFREVFAWVSKNLFEAELLGVSKEDYAKARDWYLAHACPKFEEISRVRGEKPGDLMYRCGVTGYALYYEVHGSSIGTMVNAVCGVCGVKLEDITDAVKDF